MTMKTLQEQIDKFYKETRYRLGVKDGMAYYGGSLDLRDTKLSELPDNLVVDGYLDIMCTEIAELPENLVVGGGLYLKNTKITRLPENLVVGGCLDLGGSKVTELPDNLIVGNYLDLSNTKITRLPENLIVGGSLYLRYTDITKLPDNLVVGDSLHLDGTKITELPDNLVVGGYLNIEGTKITELPDNLVVGDGLDLDNTQITELPDNLVVGGHLYLYGTQITELPDNLMVGGVIYGMSNYGVFDMPFTHTLNKEAKKKLQKIKSFMQWKVGGKTYIKVDGIFCVVDNHKGNVWITHRIGKDETLYVVTDGEGNYAHGDSLKEAKDDLIYKINDRDTSLYENLSLDDELSFEDAVAMYRTITGACVAGTRGFVESRLPKPHKERYTIKEIIDLTDGEYGSGTLKEFFKVSNR